MQIIQNNAINYIPYLNLNKHKLDPKKCLYSLHIIVKTKLHIVFDATYYLELHNAITIYCISFLFLLTKVELIFWTL